MMTHRTRLFLMGLVAAALLAGEARADELVLAEGGESLAPIVLAENPLPKNRRAAEDLAGYIEGIAGARPEVLEGQPDPLPETAIWVGHQPVLEDLFPDLDFGFQLPEEILIAANDRHLVIAGRDRWNPDHLVVEGRWRTVEGRQLEYGTANAVYTFLHDRLGVRWLWPGELGKVVPQRDRIALAPFEHRHAPQIRGRSQIIRFSGIHGHPYGVAQGRRTEPSVSTWMHFNRLMLDSLEVEGGHPFAGWWERFHETHPEYFALQPDGSRGGGETPYPRARTVKLCEANPAVWAQVLSDWEEKIESDPNSRVFHASHNDGGYSGFCICEDCRAWDHPEGEMRRFTWRGVSQNYVSISDRHVKWANTLARTLRERYPDREYYVQVHAYGHTWPAPVEATPDDNVLISIVASFLTGESYDHMSPDNTSRRQQFEEWAKVTENMVWRPNTGGRDAMPIAVLGRVADNMRFVAEHRTVGIYIDTVWEHWATQGPMYYLMARMAWDPSLDGREILDDYYRSGFGEAAGEISAYWALLEEKQTEQMLRAEELRAQGVRSEVVSAQTQVEYDDAFFEQAYGHFDRAEQAIAGEPEAYRKRVEYMRLGLDYLRLITENRNLMEEYKETEDEETAAKIRANWEEIERMAEDPTVLNWYMIRPTGPPMNRLHPDHYK